MFRERQDNLGQYLKGALRTRKNQEKDKSWVEDGEQIIQASTMRGRSMQKMINA